MVDGEASGFDREKRVREWIEALVELPGRCAGSPSEREAGARVERFLRDLGFSKVATAPVASRPRPGLTLALHTGLAALGCLLGGVAGLVASGLALGSFRRELGQGGWGLSWVLPAPPSLNVVGRLGDGQARQRVVLSAHLDAARAGLLFAPQIADRFVQLSLRLRRGRTPSAGLLAGPGRLMLAAVLVAGASWLGAGGGVFLALQVAVAAALALICAASLQWALAPVGPGANDNASGVGAMLACAEQLVATLPVDTELYVVGTGAEEVGCRGMHAFLEAHPGWDPESTFFVNFECVGGGRLCVVRSEGLLTRVVYPPVLVELARRVATGSGFGDVGTTDLVAATDGHVPAQLGLPTLSLITLEEGDVPRNYHQQEDRVGFLDLPGIVRAADFGAAVIRAALAGHAGPVAIV